MVMMMMILIVIMIVTVMMIFVTIKVIDWYCDSDFDSDYYGNDSNYDYDCGYD